MDNTRFPMAKSTDPNPLRPYYIPPSIGTSPHISASSGHAAANNTNSNNNSSYARDLLPDLDLASTGNEAWQVTRSLLDTLAWRYTSTLLAQPFDVAKTLLQVQLPGSGGDVPTFVKEKTRARRHSPEEREREESESESEETSEDEEMPDYFSQTAPTPKIRSSSRKKRSSKPRHISPSPTPSRAGSRSSRSSPSSHPGYALRLTKPASVMHAVSQLYSTSGAVGLWRASNTTFLYSILVRTTDTFIRSLLLAILGLPDIPGPSHSGLSPALTTPLAAGFSGIDLSDSPNPIGSLIIIAISSSLTGLFLLPLDMVRTRLILTPTSNAPRGLLQNLRRLPSLLAPSILYLPTALYHSLPNTFSAAMPLFLRRNLRITPESSPSLWSMAAFATTMTELFMRLPLETVVRRAQVSVLKKEEPEMPTIVTPGQYKGVWGTVYHILYVEGERSEKGRDGMIRIRKGQGVHGLVRGWRIGFWGLVGVWGAGALGAEGKGREF